MVSDEDMYHGSPRLVGGVVGVVVELHGVGRKKPFVDLCGNGSVGKKKRSFLSLLTGITHMFRDAAVVVVGGFS